uniref:Uncharacterized protein n=1 Tax=Arundo donax TaxID=35708 RepID=A0A0A8XUT6_ARUDO
MTECIFSFFHLAIDPYMVLQDHHLHTHICRVMPSTELVASKKKRITFVVAGWLGSANDMHTEILNDTLVKHSNKFPLPLQCTLFVLKSISL